MVYNACCIDVNNIFIDTVKLSRAKNWTERGKERNLVGMVDSFSHHDRPPPPITRERQGELPEVEIPPPPNAAQATACVELLPPPPSPPRRRRESSGVHSAHELLLPHRRQGLRAKIMLFIVIGFGVGILVGVGFLLG